jgi:hypothetical protein
LLVFANPFQLLVERGTTLISTIGSTTLSMSVSMGSAVPPKSI